MNGSDHQDIQINLQNEDEWNLRKAPVFFGDDLFRFSLSVTAYSKIGRGIYRRDHDFWRSNRRWKFFLLKRRTARIKKFFKTTVQKALQTPKISNNIPWKLFDTSVFEESVKSLLRLFKPLCKTFDGRCSFYNAKQLKYHPHKYVKLTSRNSKNDIKITGDSEKTVSLHHYTHQDLFFLKLHEFWSRSNGSKFQARIVDLLVDWVLKAPIFSMHSSLATLFYKFSLW